MSHAETPALVLAVHRGEAQSVDRLVTTYQDAVFTYACRLLQNRFDAQEVTQDTFIRAYETLINRYDEDRCRGLLLKPWLFRIARNLASNRRRARRRGHEDGPPVPNDLADRRPDADDLLAQTDDRRLLDLALNRLDRSSRELIVMRFIEEMSYTDMVAVVGSTDAAIRGKVFRGLKKLRTIMDEQGDDHDV